MRARQIFYALASIYVVACGFDTPPPFAGARSSDVAPWRDLGPLLFCDGDARIGRPALAQPAGFCGDGARALAACASDADCKSRERCTCAGCQVAVCDFADECAPSQVCNEGRCDRPCVRDADCAAGESCPAGQGVCRGACGSDGDCQGGEYCASGTCVAAPCSSDGDCLDRPTCAVQRVAGSLHEPSPLADGSGVTVWVERRAPAADAAEFDAGASIWRATSSDGLRYRFDPARPLLGGGAPSVARSNGGWLMVFTDGKSLRRATSSDGIAFAADPAPLVAPAAWDASGQVAPSLAPAIAGDGLLLYWAAADGSGIGVADSADGATFTPRANPVLTPAAVADPLLWRDVDAITSPFAEPVVAADGSRALRVYFAARGRESGAAVQFGMPVPEAPNFSVGEAATLDGEKLVPWPFDPVFDRVQNFVVHPAERDPAVVPVGGGRRLLYYRGAAVDGSKGENLGAADNPVPTP